MLLLQFRYCSDWYAGNRAAEELQITLLWDAVLCEYLGYMSLKHQISRWRGYLEHIDRTCASFSESLSRDRCQIYQFHKMSHTDNGACNWGRQDN